MLTLTVPHCDPVMDAEVLAKTWRRFIAGLRRYLRKYRGYSKTQLRRCVYVRVLELTPGTADDGHAHLHIWIVAPYIDKRVIAGLWWRALPYEYQARIGTVPLERKGLAPGDELALRRRNALSPDDRLRYPNVDILGVTDDRVALEIIKYLVKNRKEGEWIEPDVEGDLLMAMEGRRAVSASRGFWTDARGPASCPECGVIGEGFIGEPIPHGEPLSPVGRPHRDDRRLAGMGRGPPDRASFVHTGLISARTREILADFDQECAETGSPDSHWVNEPGWTRGCVDTRPRKRSV